VNSLLSSACLRLGKRSVSSYQRTITKRH